MADVAEEKLNEFIQGCRMVADHDLVRCSSGNLSWRLDDGIMLATASRTWMSTIEADGVAICKIDTGEALNDVSPSVELGFHAGILRERTDVNVVLHCQSPWATAVSCRGDVDSLDFFVIPEVPFYVGPIASVPFLLPGSEELAQAVVDGAKEHDLVILGNHGQTTVGRTFEDAVQKAIFFEIACQSILAGGFPVQGISEKDVQVIREFAKVEKGKSV